MGEGALATAQTLKKPENNKVSKVTKVSKVFKDLKDFRDISDLSASVLQRLRAVFTC